jgi:hypothetical protein
MDISSHFLMQKRPWMSSLNPRISPSFTNEWKGALFEYLVAREIAKELNISHIFESSLSELQRQQLQNYQQKLLAISIKTYEQLQIWPTQVAKFVVQELNLKNYQSVFIRLPSKQVKSVHEGDIALELNGSERWISLKLAKSQSFINTKSGGLKSFLTTYFPYGSSEKLQVELNSALDDDFFDFAKKLHESHGVAFSGDFTNWKKLKLTELPGELTGESHELFINFLSKQSNLLETQLKILAKENEARFQAALKLLAGCTNDQITPLYIFHKGHEVTPFLPFYLTPDQFQIFTWNKNKNQHSSFSLEFANFELQIRIKPMNTFTTLAPKVNCSVKWYK